MKMQRTLPLPVATRIAGAVMNKFIGLCACVLGVTLSFGAKPADA
jgi:hypothetical protein